METRIICRNVKVGRKTSDICNNHTPRGRRNRSRPDMRKNNARFVKDGRYSFIRKPAGVVIRPHISDSFAVRHRHRYPRFLCFLISRIRLLRTARETRGRRPGYWGQSISSGDRNRVRDYSLSLFLHSLR